MRIHGLEGTKTYDVWVNMKQRCLNPKVDSYPQYGGRGIIVTSEWLEFESFYKAMGEVPCGYSLERIDPNGNYELANCKWIPKSQQSRNTCRAIHATLNGEKKLLIEWCEEMNLKYKIIHQRVTRDDLTPEQALLKPITRSRKGLIYKRRSNMEKS